MKKYIVAAAVAVATLGFVGTADAQVGYGYRNAYNPYTGSVARGQTIVTPFGAQSVRTFSNPFTGAYAQRSMFQDAYGGVSAQTLQYNPFTGIGYASGIYNPSPLANPYASGIYNPGFYGNPYVGGYRYGVFFR